MLPEANDADEAGVGGLAAKRREEKWSEAGAVLGVLDRASWRLTARLPGRLLAAHTAVHRRKGNFHFFDWATGLQERAICGRMAPRC